MDINDVFYFILQASKPFNIVLIKCGLKYSYLNKTKMTKLKTSLEVYYIILLLLTSFNNTLDK